MLDLALALYVALALLLSLHGLHRLHLLALWWIHRRTTPLPALEGPPPFVTVQLPVFNERDVVERVVDAAAALDWPADRLEIQLLDDSTDDTAARAAAALARARARGIHAYALHRDERPGFKAGALDAGLRVARGELIAVFDADFLPPRDFLRRLVPAFVDPAVGMAQARWGHLNADEGPLTAAQAVLLDGHFVVEHAARHFSGRWFNFNGTAGVWRRACIDAAGGWEHDTLTEDLDLSYRAQLAGWRFVYLPDCVVPAELPDTMAAFRGQQRRWAKGSVETARKLTARIVAARAPLRVKGEALAHLWANLAWPPALLLATTMPLAVVARGREGGWEHLAVDLPFFLLSTGASLLFYRAAAGPGRGRDVLLALVLGVGLAASQTAAVFEALLGRKSAFVRTPKNGGGRGSYAAAGAWLPVEAVLAAVHAGTAVWALSQGLWGSVPFLGLFAAGFGWAGVAAVRSERAARAAAYVAPSVDVR